MYLPLLAYFYLLLKLYSRSREIQSLYYTKIQLQEGKNCLLGEKFCGQKTRLGHFGLQQQVCL